MTVLRVCTSTGCIKMTGAAWKLIMFTSVVNRLINTSRNERVILKVCDLLCYTLARCKKFLS
jgi:hypothetical protein